MSRLCEPW